MAQQVHSMGSKAALPPGSLVHVGQSKGRETQISAVSYDTTHTGSAVSIAPGDIDSLETGRGMLWVRVEGIHDPQIIAALGERFNLHPLVLEDIMNSQLRPKVEEFDDYIHLAGDDFTMDNGELIRQHFSVVFGKNFVITFWDGESPVKEAITNRIGRPGSRMKSKGADYLAYAVTDVVVDGYFTVLEQISESLELIEESVLDNPRRSDLEKLHQMKHRLLTIKHSATPLREVASYLYRGESPLLHGDTVPYIRDLYDHLIQIIDMVEASRENVNSMKDVFLSSVSNRMNEVMKVLTIIATLFIPLTFLAGVYGMNFKHMPELDKTWAYPAFWIVTVVIFFGMMVYFRRKRWL